MRDTPAMAIFLLTGEMTASGRQGRGLLTICARLGVAKPASPELRSASVAVEGELTAAEHAGVSVLLERRVSIQTGSFLFLGGRFVQEEQTIKIKKRSRWGREDSLL